MEPPTANHFVVVAEEVGGENLKLGPNLSRLIRQLNGLHYLDYHDERIQHLEQVQDEKRQFDARLSKRRKTISSNGSNSIGSIRTSSEQPAYLSNYKRFKNNNNNNTNRLEMNDSRARGKLSHRRRGGNFLNLARLWTIALVLSCTILLFLDLVQSANQVQEQHEQDHYGRRLLVKRRAHHHNSLNYHHPHYSIPHSFKSPHHQRQIEENQISADGFINSNHINNNNNNQATTTRTGSDYANNLEQASSLNGEMLNKFHYQVNEIDETSTTTTTTTTTTDSNNYPQVPEQQLPIVVSTSDNSYVSASPIISNNYHRLDHSISDSKPEAESTTKMESNAKRSGDSVTIEYADDTVDDDDSEYGANSNEDDSSKSRATPDEGEPEASDMNVEEANVDDDDWINFKDLGIDSLYYVESATIIKTRESINLGATFLNYTIVTNLNACLVECWITDSCDTAIYQESPVDFTSHLPIVSSTAANLDPAEHLRHHQDILSLSTRHNSQSPSPRGQIEQQHNHHQNRASSLTYRQPLNDDHAIVDATTSSTESVLTTTSDGSADFDDTIDNEIRRDDDSEEEVDYHDNDYMLLDEDEHHNRRHRRHSDQQQQHHHNRRRHRNHHHQPHSRSVRRAEEPAQQREPETINSETSNSEMSINEQPLVSGGFYLCYLFQCSKPDGFKCQFSSHNYYISSTRRKHPPANHNNHHQSHHYHQSHHHHHHNHHEPSSLKYHNNHQLIRSVVESSPTSYSKIITSPANHHRIDGRGHYDSRFASIRIGQEEHDYGYERGDLHSAVIAILFGIGATGMLIVIVGHKMKSIRERLAYKSRRRSLVPDADFLINTILDT